MGKGKRMTNEEVMQLMTDMGLHEGGIENWVMDNAWVLVVNKAIEKEREACALIADKSHRIFRDTKDAHDRNSPNSEPFNPNLFGFSVNAIEESLRITLAIRAMG